MTDTSCCNLQAISRDIHVLIGNDRGRVGKLLELAKL